MDKKQKDTWKKESEQLKRDLANRKKEVRERKVNITFGGKAPSSSKQPKSEHPLSTDNEDEQHRRLLGL